MLQAYPCVPLTPGCSLFSLQLQLGILTTPIQALHWIWGVGCGVLGCQQTTSKAGCPTRARCQGVASPLLCDISYTSPQRPRRVQLEHQETHDHPAATQPRPSTGCLLGLTLTAGGCGNNKLCCCRMAPEESGDWFITSELWVQVICSPNHN